MTAPATLAPAPGSTRAAAARTATEMADRLDRQAGRAWRAGNLGEAAQLIAAARRLDPARAALWDQREALIGSQPSPADGTQAASSHDRLTGREPGRNAEPAPARCGGWQKLIEAAPTRPGALDAGTARQVITAWLDELERPCGRCAHQQAIHTGGAARSGWPVYDRVWVHATGPCTADGCTCPHRIPPSPEQAAAAAQARAARRQQRYEQARQAGGPDDAHAYQQIAAWNAAVLARATATGPAAEDAGPAL